MEREIITTADGSTTIYLPGLDETYHSRHGAIREALHVFIKEGLVHAQEKKLNDKALSILEIGFGTGLNAFLTCLEADKSDLKIAYTAVEAFPISTHDLKYINYADNIASGTKKDLFENLHNISWEKWQSVSENFKLVKQQKTFHSISENEEYDIVYYDAFGPRVQPELWTEELFNIMYNALKPNGFLVTYCAQGNARRAMQNVGFEVERLSGPPGKREMLRANKPSKLVK